MSFYADISVDELGGKGVRWQERDAAANLPQGDSTGQTEAPVAAASPNGKLVLGSYRSIWASPEVEISPALKFLARTPTAELSAADAERLGVIHGGHVQIGSNASAFRATATVRSDVPAGFVFVEDGLAASAPRPADGEAVEVSAG